MNSIQHILCPVDFSSGSRAAFDYARELSAKAEAKLSVIHAYHLPHSLRPDLLVQTADQQARPLSELQLEQVSVALDDLLSSVGDAERATLDVHPLLGQPVETIVEFASTQGVDLIVMGARGMTRLSKLFIGGVASRVVRQAPCPVITVPEGFDGAEAAILVPVDFSSTTESTLSAAALMAKLNAWEIDLLHVTPSPPFLPPEVLLATPPQQGHTFSEVAKQSAQARLDRLVQEAEARQVPVRRAHIASGPPARTILSLVENGGYRMIAMGTHARRGVNHWFLGSVAEKVVHHSPIPVITLRKQLA